MFFPSLSEKIDLHFSDFPSQNPSETSLQQNEKLNQTLFTKKNVSSQIHFIKKANLISKVGFSCREEGIRTLDTLLEYTHFPGVLLQPLGHLSVWLIDPFSESECKENYYSLRFQITSLNFGIIKQ